MDTDSPKERLLKNKETIEKHRALITNPQFDLSIEAALLQYQYEICRRPCKDLADAAAQHYQLAGAQEFVSVLKNLSEPVTPARAKAMFPPLHQT